MPPMYRNVACVIYKKYKHFIMEGVLLPMSYEYSKYMIYSSFSLLVTAILAYMVNDITIAVYFLIVFITSINYWRHADYGIRRDVDMVMAKISFILFIQKICILNEFQSVYLICYYTCGLLFYVMEQILVYYNNLKWIIFHMAIHMYISFGVISVLLYA